uniref:Ribosome biogenesis protein NOP53 n=1 Tax=Syphacia muris TaxID=451379 RepID=A0A0N5AZ57_9BILA
MVTNIKKKRRLGISKNKKAYWRKGVDLKDVDEYLNAKRYDESTGGPIEKRPDDALFTIDVKPEEVSKLTRRQQAAMKKRELITNGEDEPLLQKPSKRALKKALKFSRKEPSLKHGSTSQMEKKAQNKSCSYDVWDCDEEVASPLQDYFERATKRKLPNRPSTLSHINSILPKVDLPSAATSYRPQNEDYEAYLSSIADEQLLREAKEKKLANFFKLPPGEHYVTKGERFLEESAGLIPENIVEFDDEDEGSDSEKAPLIKNNEKKEKTAKSVRRKLLEKKKLLKKQFEKARKVEENLVYSTKRMKKEITASMLEQEKKAKMRKAKKAMAKLTLPSNHKRFVEGDKEFLFPDELPSSLLKLNAQGSILADRRKSLQKRNILPLVGKKNKKKLKKRLKFKITEKRSHKDVTIGSHLKR